MNVITFRKLMEIDKYIFLNNCKCIYNINILLYIYSFIHLFICLKIYFKYL